MNIDIQSHGDANVNASNNNGGTAMMEATGKGHTEAVEALEGRNEGVTNASVNAPSHQHPVPCSFSFPRPPPRHPLFLLPLQGHGREEEGRGFRRRGQSERRRNGGREGGGDEESVKRGRVERRGHRNTGWFREIETGN
jgi:hypothetical protein